ncbi:MAG: hypothetical protein M1828_001670, partial [Chrysothrix sp. TS-e1954]
DANDKILDDIWDHADRRRLAYIQAQDILPAILEEKLATKSWKVQEARRMANAGSAPAPPVVQQVLDGFVQRGT